MNKKKLAIAMLACVMCMSTGAALAACKGKDNPPPAQQEQTDPVKIKDVEPFALEVNGKRHITVADYITLNGNTPTCNSSDAAVTVVYDSGILTVTAASAGEADVTISCGSVTIVFKVTVNPPPAAKYTVTIDGKTVADLEAGSEYELPPETEATVSEDFEFLGWTVNGKSKQPGDKITVTGNVVITSDTQRKAPVKVKDGGDVAFTANGTYQITVSEYITTHGNDVTATSSEEKITATHSGGVVTLTATEACGGTVTVKCGEINITFNVTVNEDLSVYRIENGGFDDGLNGWTASGEVGAISTEDTFWDKYPVGNNGNYFAGNEAGTGTVTSSEFKVGGINKITFRMGAAGNPKCYITLEDEDGTVLAVWRNTKFKDEPEWVEEEIGKTQFANNLATYVADLTAHAGKTVKIVLHDNATSGFGFINLDDVVTYYATEEELPENAYTAVNQLTVNKTALKSALDGAISEQGDYTQESFEAYTAVVENARGVYENIAATQSETDAAKASLDALDGTLVLREPKLVQGAETEVKLFVNKSKTLSVADYIDGNNLSKLTYEVSAAENSGVTVGEVDGGEFTVTAGANEVAAATVTITVKYDGTVVTDCTVTLTVSVTSQAVPTVKEQTVNITKDLYTETEKSGLTLDLAANVDNHAELPLGFTVKVGEGEATAIDGSSYTYEYGTYTEDVTTVNIAVTVSFTADETPATLEFAYVLNLTDTTAYRLVNGGFDENADGWTGATGTIGTADTYFEAKHPMNNDNGYYVGIDEGTETLTSATFTVGGTGWITFKLGSMRPYDNGGLRSIYLEVVDAETDNAVARVRNVLFSDPTAALKLNDYKLNLYSLKGKHVYLRAVDNEDGNDYRGIYLDKVVSYYPEVPTGDYTDLTAVRYLDGTLSLDLNGSASGAVVPVTLSDGIISTPSYESVKIYAGETGTEVSDDLTVDGLNVTAKKSGVYWLVYNEGTDSEFTVSVTVANTTQLPTFEDKTIEVELNGTAETALDLQSEDKRFTYAYTLEDGAAATIGEDGKFTYTGDTAQAGVAEITVTVKLTDTANPAEAYEDKTFTVTVKIKGESISLDTTKELTETYDLNDKNEAEQSSRTINFAEYLIIPEGKTVTYTGTLTVDDGVATTIMFTDSTYALNYADHSLGETAKALKFAVTASAESDTPVTINLTLNVNDTRAYRVKNGDFDDGLEGWTKVGNIGDRSNASGYWGNESGEISFQKHGDNFFHGVENKGDENVGSLSSSPFVVGGSGWITFRLGAAGHYESQYVEIVESGTNKVLARYRNRLFADRGGFEGDTNKVSALTLIKYKADLSAFKGKEVYFRIVDNWKEGGIGFVVFDDLVTYYTDGDSIDGEEAQDTLYSVLNGGFENDLSGWTMTGDLGVVTDTEVAEGWYTKNDGAKEGSKLFTFAYNGVVDGASQVINKESGTGSLKSNSFILKKDGTVAFKFGGAGGDATENLNRDVYVQICKTDGTVIAKFYNDKEGRTNTGLVDYYYTFNLAEDCECYFEVVDNSTSNYGCFVLDGVEVNCAEAPAGYNLAKNQIQA